MGWERDRHVSFPLPSSEEEEKAALVVVVVGFFLVFLREWSFFPHCGSKKSHPSLSLRLLPVLFRSKSRALVVLEDLLRASALEKKTFKAARERTRDIMHGALLFFSPAERFFFFRRAPLPVPASSSSFCGEAAPIPLAPRPLFPLFSVRARGELDRVSLDHV